MWALCEPLFYVWSLLCFFMSVLSYMCSHIRALCSHICAVVCVLLHVSPISEFHTLSYKCSHVCSYVSLFLTALIWALMCVLAMCALMCFRWTVHGSFAVRAMTTSTISLTWKLQWNRRQQIHKLLEKIFQCFRRAGDTCIRGNIIKYWAAPWICGFLSHLRVSYTQWQLSSTAVLAFFMNFTNLATRDWHFFLSTSIFFLTVWSLLAGWFGSMRWLGGVHMPECHEGINLSWLSTFHIQQT